MARTPLVRQFIRILQTANRENLKADGQPLPIPKEQASQWTRQWTRRRLLKSAAIAGGTAVATNVLSQAELALGMSEQPTIAIIGGGIAGLNAAYQLKKMGLNSTVFEARNRVGGRMLSSNNAVGAGLVVDLGGLFIDTPHEDMLALVREFNLRVFNRLQDVERSGFPETAYFFNGRLIPEAELAEKLRPLARQISSDADRLDRNFDRFAPIFDRQSVTDYLNQHTQKIPEPFVRVLIENTIRAQYGVEPEDSSALQLIFNLPTVNGRKVEILGNSDEAFTVDGGSSRIIEKLRAALSGQTQTGRRLIRIQSRNSGFRLTFERGRAVDVDHVIMTIPFSVLRDVEIQIANFPRALRRFINQLDLGSNEKVFAGFNRRIWRQANGFVNDIWTDLGFNEAWEDTQRQRQRDGALTFYLGGREVETIQALGNAQIQGTELVNRFENAIPGIRAVSTGRFARTGWTQDPLTKGSYSSYKPGQLTEFGGFLYIESDDPEERQDVNVGNLVFAGEHLSDEFYGFMNGAAQTGRLAAEVVIRNIRQLSF